jgi:glutamine synthetase
LIKLYGEDNKKRLTGKNVTHEFSSFNCGTGDRSASVRIGNSTVKDEKGYYEDRRPGANMDPYVVTSALFSVTCLDDPESFKQLEDHYLVFLKNKEDLSNK